MHLWKRAGFSFDLLHASFSFNDIGSYKSVSHFCRDQSLSPSSGWLGHDYTPKRVRRAVALHRSRFQPDLPIEEEEDEPSMDGFVPCESPVERERERSRNRKDKHIVVDDDEAGGGDAFPKLSSEIILMVSRLTLKSCLVLTLQRPKVDPSKGQSLPRRRGWSTR